MVENVICSTRPYLAIEYRCSMIDGPLGHIYQFHKPSKLRSRIIPQLYYAEP